MHQESSKQVLFSKKRNCIAQQILLKDITQTMGDVKTTCAIFFTLTFREDWSTKGAINKLKTLFKIIWIGHYLMIQPIERKEVHEHSNISPNVGKQPQFSIGYEYILDFDQLRVPPSNRCNASKKVYDTKKNTDFLLGNRFSKAFRSISSMP